MKTEYRKLGEYIQSVDVRNSDLRVSRLLGLSIEKCFIESIANTIGTDFRPYKIVKKGQFAYGPVTSRNGDKITIALLEEPECIISSSYAVFEITDTSKLLPEYLMLWFSRPEFDRYARFKSHGSVREIFDWDEICRVELPVPDLTQQQHIVNAYNIVNRRIQLLQQINGKLEAAAQCLFDEELSKKENFYDSTLEEVCNITTGDLNSEDATPNGKYPFFTCSQETYKTDSYAFDQEAVLLAGNNASAIYPLKIFEGKFNAYQRTYVISSKNNFVTNKQIFLSLKQKLSEFREVSLGTTTKFLTMKILNPIPIKIPKENIAKSFNNKLNILFSQIKENEIEIEKLQNLKQLIISRISGM